MRTILMTVLSLLFLGGLIITHTVFSQNDFKKIKAEELKQKIESGMNGVLLDVRTPGEVENGILPGAEIINFQDEDFEDKIAALDKSETYYIYCHSGGRSARTQNMMKQMGFENVFEYSGGYSEWSALGYPLVKP